VANARWLLVPSHGALFGAWVQPAAYTGGGTASEESAVVTFEHQLGRKLAIDQLYTPWAAPLPVAVARWDLRHGRLPMISWGGTNTERIAAGDYDAQIRRRARQLRALHKPVLLRWFAEMSNGQDLRDSKSPATFIAAWRRMHDIFASVGAANVRWVWCPGAYDFISGHAQLFYPGASYVDWIGADGFNWAPLRAGAAWTSFGQIFSVFYQWGVKSGKPLLIGEYGALERHPGEKAAWFAQAGEQLKTRFPGIRALIYFESFTTDHSHDHLLFNWRATSSRSALRGFASLATDPYFQARPSL
jgi:Glycosyl hydrolase family 26